MAFTFIFSRHGSRTPYIDDKHVQFSKEPGTLTSQGMRQRYLKGRYNRERLIDQHGLLSAEFEPGQLYMQSSNSYRTMQSGYSELLGLYPPSERVEQDPIAKSAYLNPVTNPPFNVRDQENISASLGNWALPNNFQSVPIFNLEPTNIGSFLTWGCD